MWEPPDPLDAISVAEAREVLAQELARLPEKFRNPLVLCCLQGLARDEAARQLGWSVSVLKSRLEQGRDRLRDRLTRRGLTLAGALGTSLLGDQVNAAIPAALLDQTVHAGAVVATGGAATSVVSIQSAAFTREVLNSMRVKKLCSVAAVVLVAGLATSALVTRTAAEAAPAKTGGKEGALTDQEKLQGTWEVVELVKGGVKVMPAADLKGTIELKGDGFRFVLTPTGMAEFTRTTATFTLDAAKSPKAIDVTPAEGAGKGQVSPGIYEVNKDDLTICLAQGPLEARPTAFEAHKEDVVLFKLKRVKK